MLCKIKSLLASAVGAGASLNWKLCLLKFKETIWGRAVYLPEKYQQKLRAYVLPGRMNFLVLPHLTQVWHLKTGERGVVKI